MFFSTDTKLDPMDMDYVMRQLHIIGEFDKRELPDIMAATAPDFYKEVANYPAMLANQRYIRTGTYGRSVFTEIDAKPNGMALTAGSRGAIQNGRRYDPYLKDERNQASIHSDRWTTLADDADATMPKLEQRLRTARDKMVL